MKNTFLVPLKVLHYNVTWLTLLQTRWQHRSSAVKKVSELDGNTFLNRYLKVSLNCRRHTIMLGYVCMYVKSLTGLILHRIRRGKYCMKETWERVFCQDNCLLVHSSAHPRSLLSLIKKVPFLLLMENPTKLKKKTQQPNFSMWWPSGDLYVPWKVGAQRMTCT